MQLATVLRQKRRKEHVLAASSAEHDLEMHGVTEVVILSLPVVHWQTVSLEEQPESWMAAAKQASCNAVNTVSSCLTALMHLLQDGFVYGIGGVRNWLRHGGRSLSKISD